MMLGVELSLHAAQIAHGAECVNNAHGGDREAGESSDEKEDLFREGASERVTGDASIEHACGPSEHE